MSMWADLETAVVTELAGLIEGDAPLLATVAGHAAADRKSLILALLGERLPAAYVIPEGREAWERSSGRPGHAIIRVLLATRCLRAGADGRLDGVDSLGIYSLAGAAGQVLQNLETSAGERLRLVREEALPVQDGAALWELTFGFRKLAELTPPTFGGVVLTGQHATVHVEVGELRAVSSSFSFPGIDGVFERRLGVRERPIWWRGELRDGNTELNSIESNIENELRTARAKTMTDGYGQQFEDCVLKAFRRVGARVRDAVSGEAAQDFEMEFTQIRG